jgi:hypothetical protein
MKLHLQPVVLSCALRILQNKAVSCVFTAVISGYLHIHDAEYVLAEDLIQLERGKVCDTCARQLKDAEVHIKVQSEELHPRLHLSMYRQRSCH